MTKLFDILQSNIALRHPLVAFEDVLKDGGWCEIKMPVWSVFHMPSVLRYYARQFDVLLTSHPRARIQLASLSWTTHADVCLFVLNFRYKA